MEKLKLIYKIIYLFSLTVLLQLLIGCGSTSRVVTREVKVPYEVTIKDTIALRDTIIAYEPIWIGEVVDSLNNVIGNIKVHYKKKLAELTISKKDTVKKIDTIYVEQPFNDFIVDSTESFSLAEKIVMYSVAALTILILMIRKKKK